ncbi:Cullin-9 [Dissostichus eleginoides]|uniref:Cullin-9 n=1 Tax=Dissostichus eleginoides TaxID=100907 RepID=A0AAD9CP35_DISEL|nr:Cullin-9 [Dissostichus eleginoides]
MSERRGGNLLVQLAPRLQAFPEELLRQRRNHEGQMEYLIRWCLVTIDDGTGGGASEGGGASSDGGGASGSGSDSKAENVLMWMSLEDVYCNCPSLLGKRKDQEANQEREDFPPDHTFDEGELSDMKEDVKNLVRRARKQMLKKSDFSISITHTVHVLSAYAAIGSLVGVFKETGALHLLMELLCNKETQTRRSAGKMLRALASHDAGSRAYVLLSLSQQDGIEQHMDFDNRYTLLELFAETTSSEEHGCPSRGSTCLRSQRYLCVTSLMDKLNTAGGGESERQESPAASSSSPAPSTSSSAPSTSSPAHLTENRLQRQFDFTMAMANLISELVRVMGWDRNRGGVAYEGGEACEGGGACGDDSEERNALRSIFQPRFSGSSSTAAVLTAAPANANANANAAAAQPQKKTAGNAYKTRSDFSSRSAYVEYVQEHLKSGMTVRMLEDYEEVSSGDEGEFRTYWVHWFMVRVLGGGSQTEKGNQEKASSLTETLKLSAVSQTFFSKPPGGLYSLPYLSEGPPADPPTLSRAEWWEVLFFIRKLEAEPQQEDNALLQGLHHQVAPLDDSSLIGLSVPGGVARKLLHFLKHKLPIPV